MEFNVAVLRGDGIGPEVITEALKALQVVGEKFGHSFYLHDGLIGGVAIDTLGTALADETLRMCKQCDTVLLGSVGGSKWDDPQAKIHPEDGLLALRKGLKLFANLRPVKVLPMLVDSANLKPEVVRGVDLMVVRELTGGLYFGQPKRQWRTPKGRQAVDTLAYSEVEIERILRVGFELALSRRNKLTSVDKANVLQSSRLWRQIATEVSADYPDVELQHMLVDACAMRFIQCPAEFDVLVTGNMFGDILTDEASMLAGSMGMLPSASLAGIPRGKTFGMYEPIHGSAPSRAGQDLANPIATILSVAMMLRYSFALETEAQAVENAVLATLEQGYRTYDIMSEGKIRVGTKETGDLIAQKVKG
ncbi:MAG: 3-isopropylmalate dehydrogenase [Phycisphaerae bacterium SM1_79]|jgi:3-isopropylmalate dehydrogenase|nr:MAG: 3-isopropylmalate dehydrogenase [Phycisphaerae bacterium SM1_79]